jgi:hypothetical protein
MGNRWRQAAAATTLILGLAGPAGSDSRPAIAVVVYDQARVPNDTLTRAQTDVARIYSEAGVDVTWMESATVRPVGMFTIRLLIRRHAIGAPGPVMGTAIGDPQETNGSAFVFYQQVLNTAHRGEQDVARVLAYAMAHEMGHLILPSPAHSSSGIMRANWDGDDLQHIADGSLAFSPGQARLMQARATAAAYLTGAK